MTDARAWLDQVDARTNAATDGPWDARMDTPSMGGSRWSLRRAGVPGLRMAVTEYQHGSGNAEFIAAARTDLPAATAALRAVLDLHQPHNLDNGTSINYLCVECLARFPCPTVTAITTALEDA